MNQFECEKCGIKDALVFHCNYCGGYFCAEHHLPENHKCTNKPKIAPFHVRPQEVKPHEPSVISYPPAKQHSNTNWQKFLGIGIAIVIIAILLLCSAFLQNYSPTPTPSITPDATPIASTPNIISPTISIPTATPALTTSYVEVGYQTIGWFFNSISEYQGYNYTYLILNVTITNHGYSQVNVFGDLGFSVIVNNDEYVSANVYSLFSYYNSSGSGTYYVDYPWVGTSSDYLNLGSSFQGQVKLLDTGSVSGTIVFKFGDTNVYPQQPQILYKPFTLKYSVTYGKNGSPLFGGPYATVIVNQK